MRERYAKDELLSVGEFAELVGASRSQLIYYDKQGLFSPLTHQEVGAQAANRRYTLDQAYTFRMISLFQQMGCSLELASRFASASLEDCEDLLHNQQKKLDEEALRLKTMRASVDMMLWMDNISKSIKGSEPVAFSLDAPRICAWVPFDPSCIRNTRRFVMEYGEGLKKMTENGCVLPAPVGLVYSSIATKEGYFPVKGILAMRCGDDGRKSTDFVLEPGRYLTFKVRAILGKFENESFFLRKYLLSHHLVRVSHLIGWNVSVKKENEKNFYTELVTIRVVDGDPPMPGMPVMPGVE